MTKNLSNDEVLTLVKSGNHSGLIGLVEREELEFKKAPYRLEEDRQKNELAKGVTALANAAGGLILIGARTRKDPTHQGDEVIDACLHERALVDQRQYLDVLKSWVYPPLTEVTIDWYPGSTGGTLGVTVISVPAAADEKCPYLVTKLTDDDGKIKGILFGCFVRHRDGVDSLSVEELHTRIRDGLRFSEVSSMLGNLQETLGQLIARSNQSLSDQVISDKVQGERMMRAVIAAGLNAKPAYVLAVFPSEPCQIPSLFQSRHADVVRIMEDPPKLRPNGFNLDTGETSRIVSMDLRRTVSSEYKLLEIWRDGAIVFVARGDHDFLCHATKSEESSGWRINNLVLAESVFLFATFAVKVFDFASPKPQKFKFALWFRDMKLGEKTCVLNPNPLGSLKWDYHMEGRAAQAGDISVCVDSSPNDAPEKLAFDLLGEVYTSFGFEHDRVPYAELRGNGGVIKPELFIKTKG